MLKPTKAHKESIDGNRNIYSLRIGNKVPSDAIGLSYFYNIGGGNESDNGSENILAVDSPRNSNDHIEIMDQKKIDGLSYKNESVFPKHIDYNDEDGYVGILYLTKIEWVQNPHEKSKYCVVRKEYKDLSQQVVPSSISHSENGMSGTLHIKDEFYTPTAWEERKIEIPMTKTFVRSISAVGLPTAAYNFPKTYAIDDEYGYKGEIPLIQSSITYTEVNNDSNVKNVIITKEYNNGEKVKDTVDYTYNGKVYQIPLVSQTEEVAKLKHYGVCRYWGYSSTGLYGTIDRKYAATSYGGKGYFSSDKYPAQIANRYGHYPVDSLIEYKNFTVKSAYTKNREWNKGTNNVKFFYLDETITKVDGKPYSLVSPYTSYWNKNVVYSKYGLNDLADGISWTYDLEKSSYYGSPNNLKHGGCLWVSQYIEKENVWPPVGYESDPIYRGNSHMTLVTDDYVYHNGKKYTSGNITLEGTSFSVNSLIKINNYPKNKVIMSNAIVKRNCLFSKVTRCTTALAYPGNQQYSRMTIQFYTTTTRKIKATYSMNLIIPTGKTYTASATYMGDLTTKYEETDSVPVRWDCNTTYEGIIKSNYYTYDGLATYRGIALRRKVVGNISPQGLEEKIMYPNDQGYLSTVIGSNEHSDIDGQNFMITDVYNDNTPLFYSYRLFNYVYDLDGPDASGMYCGNYMKLVDENNIELKKPYLYKIKLIPTEFENLYIGYVYTSFLTTSSKNIYCVYNSCQVKNNSIDFSSFKSSDKELISVNEAYQIGRDYIIEKLKGYRKSKIKVFDKNIIKDSRRKIPITYLVKTTDNKYVSNPIHANVINKQYSFKSESKEFDGNNHIISPMYGKEFLTARDILAKDLGLDHKFFDGKQFTVEFYNSESSKENYKKVYLYTNQDGFGSIVALTSDETGFFNKSNGEYDKVYNYDSLHQMHDNSIYPVFTVLNKDVRTIKLESPNSNNLLESWYPRIKFGSFSQILEQYNSKIKVTYSIPEFSKQRFNSSNGEPYKHIKEEELKVINENELKTSKKPLFVKTDKEGKIVNLVIYKESGNGNYSSLTIKSWSCSEGIISVLETLNDTDRVYASYEYEEEYYIYRGYYNNENFIDIDINPSIYHDYLDTRKIPYERKKTIELFDSSIYFFIKPKLIENLNTGEVITNNESVLYHKFDNTNPNGEHDLLIGSLLIRHNTSLISTTMIDIREQGGGLLVDINDKNRKMLEPESDYYFDIGYYDGEMYQENSTTIIRINKYLLKENGGKFTRDYIDNVINKWIPLGVNCIIEYVDVILENENPNNDINVVVCE